jgi:hypothetical protein
VYGLKERPDYGHIEKLVVHYDEQQSKVYILDGDPCADVEIDSFLANYLSLGEVQAASDIR